MSKRGGCLTDVDLSPHSRHSQPVEGLGRRQFIINAGIVGTADILHFDLMKK